MKRLDLTNKRFGKIVCIKPLEKNNHGEIVWLCKCDCGNYCQIQHQYLAFGDTTSCGCIRSKGEFQIEQLLKEHNINFQREYSFENLKDKLNLRFDFAIFNNKNELLGLIEYQGEQHYCKSNGFYSEDLIKHDKMKIDFCNKNNIKLKHIIYKKNYNLTWEDLRLEDFNVL